MLFSACRRKRVVKSVSSAVSNTGVREQTRAPVSRDGEKSEPQNTDFPMNWQNGGIC